MFASSVLLEGPAIAFPRADDLDLSISGSRRTNGLTLSGVSALWQGTVSGVILIAAVGLGVLRDRGISLRQRRAAKAAPDASHLPPHEPESA